MKTDRNTCYGES